MENRRARERDAEPRLVIDLSEEDQVRPAAVPFVDLRALHLQMKAEIQSSWGEIIDSSAFIGGRFVERFEEELATYLGVGHAVGVANGTDAITLALRALGLKPGDGVVIPANTFFATAEAVVHAGGRPILVDVDPETATMDPSALAAAVDGSTRFVVPVHLYGQPADMNAITEIATAFDLRVVEDNAQALGATYRGRRAGTLGHAAATSFYPGKNLGALGDGGCVTTNDAAVAESVRILANHGQRTKHEHVEVGWNSRLDAIQAAVLSIKLRYLDNWNDSRRRVAELYNLLLGASPLELPFEASDRVHIYHLFVVRHLERQRLQDVLGATGVATGRHYPVPIHLTPAFAYLGEGEGSFPHAEAWARHGFSLPMHPALTEQDVHAVAAGLLGAFEDEGVFESQTA